MRMSTDSFDRLSNALQPLLDTHPTAIQEYHKAGHSMKRFRWAVLYASKYDIRSLYNEGLTDNHIDTALRKITKTA
jgi:hypothetical protein